MLQTLTPRAADDVQQEELARPHRWGVRCRGAPLRMPTLDSQLPYIWPRLELTVRHPVMRFAQSVLQRAAGDEARAKGQLAKKAASK